MNNNYKLLIRKNLILDYGLKSKDDPNTIIPFNKMSIKTYNDDPSNIVIPSVEEVLKMINDLKDANFDIIGTFNFPAGTFTGVIPTEAELNTLYNGGGISVKLINGTTVIFKAGTANVFKATEGFLCVNTTSGEYEVAGYLGNTIVIDSSANTIPAQINAIKTQQMADETKIINLELADTSFNSRLVNIEEKKVIQTSGEINLKEATEKLFTEESFVSQILSRDGRLNQIDATMITQQQQIEFTEQQVSAIAPSVEDYKNKRNSFIQIGDLVNSIVINLSPSITGVATSNGLRGWQVVYTFPTITTFKAPNVVELDFQKAVGQTFNVKDSYNDGNYNNQTITLGITPIGISCALTPTTFTITGDTTTNLSQTNANLIAGYLLLKLSQAPDVVPNVDQTARDSANVATIKANNNNALITGIKTDITNINNDLALKQDKTDQALTDPSKNVITAINNNRAGVIGLTVQLQDKQDKTDAALLTNDKTIVGAINETYNDTGSIITEINTLKTGRALKDLSNVKTATANANKYFASSATGAGQWVSAPLPTTKIKSETIVNSQIDFDTDMNIPWDRITNIYGDFKNTNSPTGYSTRIYAIYSADGFVNKFDYEAIDGGNKAFFSIYKGPNGNLWIQKQSALGIQFPFNNNLVIYYLG